MVNGLVEAAASARDWGGDSGEEVWRLRALCVEGDC